MSTQSHRALRSSSALVGLSTASVYPETTEVAFELAAIALGPLTYTVLVTAGLFCVALYMAGIGGRSWRR